MLEHARARRPRRPSSRGRRGSWRRRSPWRRAAAGPRPRAPAPTEPGRRAELRRVERLHRVDHADVGPLALERRADGVELGLGEDLDVRRRRRAASARSFTCADDSSPVTSSARPLALTSPRARISSSVDLPTPGSPPTSTSDAGTSPPPSTRSSSGTPVGIRSASSALTSTSRSERLCGAAPLRCRRGALLDERPERAAPRALAEPAPGRVAALGARELDRRLRHGHGFESRREPDGGRADSCRFA